MVVNKSVLHQSVVLLLNQWRILDIIVERGGGGLYNHHGTNIRWFVLIGLSYNHTSLILDGTGCAGISEIRDFRRKKSDL